MPNKIIEGILPQRLFFLDWVRVLAFAFLIFYHTAMMFVDWSFHIESGHNSNFLKSVMILSSRWRLDILFLVSGVAISFMVTKMSLRSFTWQRVIKLYLPLVFAIAVVVAPQSYFEALQKGVFEGSFWQFWTNKYFTFTWDERMNAPFPTYNHMWYVLYLFNYTVALLPLMAFINSQSGASMLSKIEVWLMKGTRIIWVPMAIYLSLYFLFDNHNITHAFFNDWFGHCIYLFAVIMGLIFVRIPRVWQSFENNRYLALIIGLVSYGALLAIFYLPVDAIAIDRTLAWDISGTIVKWSWIVLIIGFARRYLNFSNRGLRYCNSAVYPFFILHQTVIIVFGYCVIDWGFSAQLEFLIIFLGTFGICGLLYELIVKRFNVFRRLFGMNLKSTLEAAMTRKRA